ncbi:MAG: 5-dehydro-2-deoxygluconokinase [Alphaproteobacteria bacterium ADurb.Bin438]|nr:MAG: 5-dehydro-2-deoxygluconokinase [Alphaproteobacteria bacterium ADurb.Bin438]
MKYDVLGIGNPIIDITSLASEGFLKENQVCKGAMNLVDKKRLNALKSKLENVEKTIAGSVANTVYGLAYSCAKCAFIGKVAKDEEGDFYKSSFQNVGVDFETKPCFGEATGVSLILVSEDFERSMNTYLGASLNLSVEDVCENTVKNSKIILLEGYLMDSASSKEVLFHVLDLKTDDNKIALTLSDSLCVKRHRDDFLKLLNTGKIEILFANLSEITELFGEDFETKATSVCDEIVVTLGKKGALSIIKGDKFKANAKGNVIIKDTTGAGDLFASGYLYGILHNKPPLQRLEIGILSASEIISHFGTKPKIKLKELMN